MNPGDEFAEFVRTKRVHWYRDRYSPRADRNFNAARLTIKGAESIVNLGNFNSLRSPIVVIFSMWQNERIGSGFLPDALTVLPTADLLFSACVNPEIGLRTERRRLPERRLEENGWRCSQ